MAYRGIPVPLPIGLLGLHGSKNPSQLSPAHLSFVEGVDIDGGLLRKHGGALALNQAEFVGDVVSGTTWSPEADAYHDVVLLNNGIVVKDTGSREFPTILTSGININLEPPAHFLPAGGESVGATRKLFMFSAGNQVQYVDGTDDSMQAIETPAADWSVNFPTFGAAHQFRVWAGGNANDPHRMYYSTPTNHRDFTGTGAGTIAVYPGEGERLVGAISFRDLLLVWKYPVGIYAIDTRNADLTAWSVKPITRAVGGINAQTIVPVASDVLYMDHAANLHLLSATEATGDINTSNVSQIADMAKFVRDNVSVARIRRACSLWYPDRQQAWFFVPEKASFENNLRIVVDQSDPNVGTRFYTSRRDTATSAWMRPDDDRIPRPVIGEGTFIQRLDQLARNKNGEAYTVEFETANIDFGFAQDNFRYKTKNGEFIDIISDFESLAIVEVDVIWDDVVIETIVFNIGAVGAALDEFILDTDALAASGTKSLRRRLPGSGERLRLRFKNDGLDEDLAISAVYVSFTVTDEGNRGE